MIFKRFDRNDTENKLRKYFFFDSIGKYIVAVYFFKCPKPKLPSRQRKGVTESIRFLVYNKSRVTLFYRLAEQGVICRKSFAFILLLCRCDFTKDLIPGHGLFDYLHSQFIEPNIVTGMQEFSNLKNIPEKKTYFFMYHFKFNFCMFYMNYFAFIYCFICLLNFHNYYHLFISLFMLIVRAYTFVVNGKTLSISNTNLTTHYCTIFGVHRFMV